MEKAGFFSRFFALLIDGILIGVIGGIIGGCLLGVSFGLMSGSESGFLNFLSVTLAFLLIVVLFFLQFLYFGYFWGKDGQSLGMKLLNMKVVRRTGEELTFLRAGLRGTFGYWVSGLVFYLGFIWAAFDQEKETWHDKIFDTWVVTT